MAQIIERDRVEDLFRRVGVEQFLQGWDGDNAVLMFRHEGITYKIGMEMPLLKDYKVTDTGRRRTSDATIFEAWTKACRDAWKDMYQLVNAKLTFILNKRSTIEKEFLAYMVTNQGEVAGDFLIPQLKNMAEGVGLQVNALPSTVSQE